jgi:hemerythrin superfamily protein
MAFAVNGFYPGCAMNTALTKLSPSATEMIRADHTHVLSTFHKFKADTPPRQKQAVVELICTALEIHAQLEEEFFYPALRDLDPHSALVGKSVPEHDQMRRLIAKLRGLSAGDTGYDDTFHELMRDVLHHVADEETTLLPAAERLLADRLHELGGRMTKRRMQLTKPHLGELAKNTAKATSASTLLIAGSAFVLGGWVLKRAFGSRV